ncbi:MAG: zinc ABC transporter substrate-binding protein [Bacilli bacterium]|nr:zinc ABC transporter substrate-binding protein [Bacilli bacterium]
MKKIFKLFILLALIPMCGCLKNDNMEDITIYTTTYPIEYVVKRLYGEHSNIKSIYPNGVDVNNYEVTNILLDEYSNTDMFIFNGQSKEKNYVKDMRKNNKKLKIIDVTNDLTYEYYTEELWLDPNNLLTIANNIKKGFTEYIQASYLVKEVEKNYEDLKVDLTAMDAKYRKAGSNSKATIVVSSDMFLFLKKYNINVISLEENDNLTQRDVITVKNLIDNEEIKYIYLLKGEEANNTIKELIDGHDINLIELHTLSNLDDDEKDKYDYISLQNLNLENLKLQLEQ